MQAAQPRSTRCWRTSIRTAATWRVSRSCKAPGPPRPKPARNSRPPPRSWPPSCSRCGRRPTVLSTSLSCWMRRPYRRRRRSRHSRRRWMWPGSTSGTRKSWRPTTGVLGQRQMKPGQLVGVGGQLTTLTPLPRIWVIANYKETQLTHMAAGGAGEHRRGCLSGTYVARQGGRFRTRSGLTVRLAAAGTTRPATSPRSCRRVAVKISVEDADGLIERLRPGMSVVATVDTGGNPW